MKRLLSILGLVVAAVNTHAAQIWTVNSVNDLIYLNASTINSNVFVVCGSTFADGLGGIFTFERGSVAATNDIANRGPFASVNPLSPSGLWFVSVAGSTPSGDALWTNSVAGGVSILEPVPTLSYSYLYASNFVTRGTVSMLSKSQALTLGTNVIEAGTRSQFILQSPTNDATQVILALDAGTNTIQILEIYSFDTNGAFTLPNNSHVYNASGGVVKLLGDTDWVSTNASVSILRFVSPDWREIGRWQLNQPPPLPGGGYWTNIAGILQQIDKSKPVMVTNKLEFGFGETNYVVLDPSGTALDVVNSGGTAGVNLQTGGGGQLSFVVNDSSDNGQVNANKTSLIFGNSTANLQLIGNNLSGNVHGHTLGSKLVSFGDLWDEGTIYVSGLFSLPFTNYSRLAISHGGTNGAVVFDSQASGIAGNPRPFDWDWNGTNAMRFSASAGVETLKLSGNVAGSTIVSIDDSGNGSKFLGGSASSQWGIADGSVGLTAFSNNRIVPSTDAVIDLGSTSSAFRRFYLASADIQIEYGSTNATPSTPATPIYWVEVTVRGDTNLYKMPLYK
jgi:hypothetical protein